jgi:hypothetical protein
MYSIWLKAQTVQVNVNKLNQALTAPAIGSQFMCVCVWFRAGQVGKATLKISFDVT